MKTVQPLRTSSVDRFEQLYVRPAEGRTLIVGSRIYREREDRRKRYADVIGVDMQEGPGVDWVQDLEEPVGFGHVRSYRHIECMSVLEHSRRPWLIAANLERMLMHGGTLYLTAPFAWAVHGYPSDYFRFTVAGLQSLFPSITWLAAQYAERTLVDEVKRTHIGSHPFLPRTEVCAFGRLEP
jgi:hypothetical protein